MIFKKYPLCHIVECIKSKYFWILNTLRTLKQKIAVTKSIDIQINKEINYGYRLNKDYDKRLKIAVNNTDIFFSISNNIYNDLLDLGVSKEKIVNVPNGVDIKKISEIKNIDSKIGKRIKLITVARFAKNKKGLDLIPEIAKKLIDNNINFEWSLVGSDSKKISFME